MDNPDSKIFNSNIVFKFAMYLLLLIIPLIILFLWQEDFFSNRTISHEKFGTFGDFFGGVLGSIWALCGVLLFYLALKEQRGDFANNKIALMKQIDALTVQTDEFKLQRNELQETRKIFTEQSKTLKQQRFESTFFSLIDLYNKIISNLHLQDSNKNYFKSLKNKLYEDYKSEHEDENNIVKCHEYAAKSYLKIFYDNKEELTYYYRTIYRVLSIIDNSELTELEKILYVKILRSQLSENELLFLFYNSNTKYGGKFYPYILKYNLLKHLPLLSKIEFQYYVSRMGTSSDFHHFNSYIFDLLCAFINNLNKNINEEWFSEEEASFQLESDEKIIISFSSNEVNILNIKFILTEKVEKVLCFKFDLFEDYFKNLLFDFLIYSRYNDSSDFDIECNKLCDSANDNMSEFIVSSRTRIQINKD